MGRIHLHTNRTVLCITWSNMYKYRVQYRTFVRDCTRIFSTFCVLLQTHTHTLSLSPGLKWRKMYTQLFCVWCSLICSQLLTTFLYLHYFCYFLFECLCSLFWLIRSLFVFSIVSNRQATSENEMSGRSNIFSDKGLNPKYDCVFTESSNPPIQLENLLF